MELKEMQERGEATERKAAIDFQARWRELQVRKEKREMETREREERLERERR